MSGVAPGDQRVAGFVEKRFEVGAELLAAALPMGASKLEDALGQLLEAQLIFRRGGAEFACNSADTHVECSQLLRRLKNVALPEFGVEDDPTQMPYSTLVKIQFGGLLGLQRITAATESTANGIADIASLIDAAKARFASIDAVPCESLCADITNYKLSRRRRR